jgi:beta-aspartyl-peptidase (threonine type)
MALGACERSETQEQGPGNEQQQKTKEFAIAIHGGAGTISRNKTDSVKKDYREALDRALSVGKKVLVDGGTALDVVEQTIQQL